MRKCFIFFVVLLVCGCTAPATKKEVPDFSKIVNYFPDSTEPLIAGSTVKMNFVVSYNLVSADAGTLALIVQDASVKHVASERYPIKKGNGVQILEIEFKVPNTRMIEVFTPLTLQGDDSTSIVDYKQYLVKSL